MKNRYVTVYTKEVKKIFEQLQKRSVKMQITQKSIDKIKKISLREFDDEESGRIQLLHKELLRISMMDNDSNEIGMLVNLLDWEYITVFGTENGISLAKVLDAKELVCTAPKNSL